MKHLTFPHRAFNVTLFAICSMISANLYSQENVLPETGNVGIGTTNPTEKLQVNGTARIDSMLVVKDSMIVHKGTILQDNLTVDGDLKLNGNAYFNQPIYYYNTPSLSNSANNLKLYGTDETGIVKSLTVPELVQGVITGSYVTCNPEANGSYLPYWKSGTNKVYVDCPNTFVGINTINPSHNLHIEGDQYTSGYGQMKKLAIHTIPTLYSDLKIETSNPSGAAIEILSNTTTDYTKSLFIHANSPKAEIMKVVKDSDDPSIVRFMLTADGYLQIHNGIQKTLQLETDGLLRARRIKVDVVNWADYVFEPTHVLPTIKEVENYISENKHLPGIPDAKSIENEGLDIAETSKLMMEQIEEQMLYIIQLKKEIELLKTEMNELKKGE